MNQNEREYCLKLRKANRSVLRESEDFYRQALEEIEKLRPKSRRQTVGEVVDVVDTGRFEKVSDCAESTRKRNDQNQDLKEVSFGFERTSSPHSSVQDYQNNSSRPKAAEPAISAPNTTTTTAQVHERPKQSEAEYSKQSCSADGIAEFIEMGKRKPRRILLVSDKVYHDLTGEIQMEANQNTFCSNKFHCSGGCYCAQKSKVKPLLNHCIHCQSFNSLLRKKSDLKLSTVALPKSNLPRSTRSKSNLEALKRQEKAAINKRSSCSTMTKHRIFSMIEPRYDCTPVITTSKLKSVSSDSEDKLSSSSSISSRSSTEDEPPLQQTIERLNKSTSTLKLTENERRPASRDLSSKASLHPKMESRSCQTSPIREEKSNKFSRGDDGGVQNEPQSPPRRFKSQMMAGGDSEVSQNYTKANIDELNRVKDFRNQNLFECHSSTSLVERDKGFMSNVMHTCEHEFYLNNRLFPTPCNPDHKNESRCKVCALPARSIKSTQKLDEAPRNGTSPKEGVWINVNPLVASGSDDEIGVLTSKIIIEPNGVPAELKLKFPMKESVLIQERKCSPVKGFNKTANSGVLKVNSSFFRKIEPPLDSLALKYQKGYREMKKCS